MYKIAICDDDKRYRKTIREIVEHENSLPENEIRFYEYESGNELLKHTDILQCGQLKPRMLKIQRFWAYILDFFI